MEINEIKTNASKVNVEKAVRDAIELHGMSSQGSAKLGLNGSQCFMACFASALKEVVESSGGELPDGFGFAVMKTWESFPKNPSAFRQQFFEKGVEGEKIEAKYDFL